MVFGLYPAVTLAQACGKREDVKRILAAGGDPGAAKQANWSQGYADDIQEYLRKDIFPHIGKLPVTEITPMLMLAVLKPRSKSISLIC